MQIRAIEEKDFQSVIDLNAEEVISTSYMDAKKLCALLSYASFAKVVVLNNLVVAFVIAIENDKDYINENYAWFSSRYKRFLYVDRVVVSEAVRGKGIGSRIYENLFSYARDECIDHVLCEYNVEPMNAVSQAFHNRWGFKEVGTQHLSKSSKIVALQAAKT